MTWKGADTIPSHVRRVATVLYCRYTHTMAWNGGRNDGGRGGGCDGGGLMIVSHYSNIRSVVISVLSLLNLPIDFAKRLVRTPFGVCLTMSVVRVLDYGFPWMLRCSGALGL